MFNAFVREADRLVRADIGAANPPAILWADIVHPTADDAANAAALLGISIPTLPEMQEI